MSARTSRSSEIGAVFVCGESKEWAVFCPEIQRIQKRIVMQRYRRLSTGMRAIIDEGIVELALPRSKRF
jgi:hypothetical protein